ncbi:DUF4180 domain-containing protein [Streptomyces sp. PSKA54]|uniref:DUF4180 domain-containing protein n=1 Tax=Streptomyces himalayensis subsp. aureolus TaxID=2758039 RepID=A0A7W2D8C5_9ACTN|nr:DUF4180 domain-containing protein [Streptomyces himalayensis]MBA4866498.1 DUF4180 domain-containing protein [Streptomyces himalayensis subsp. aureolus]
MTSLEKIHDVPVLMCAAEGAAIEGERDALDLIGDATYQGARWVVVPAQRFGDDFFHLRTRIAGHIVQKFAQYGMGLVVLGDISRHLKTSSALEDFVRESNGGRQLWFLQDKEQLADRLQG